MVSKKSVEVANAFIKYAKTGNKSLIEKFTRKEIEAAILQYHLDKEWPHYESMQKRLLDLKEKENYKQKEKEKLEDRTVETKRHKTNIRLKKISIFVLAVGTACGIYSVFIYPPKYVLDDSSLHFDRYFKGWIKRAQKEGKNIYQGGAEFKLHFVLRNVHRGEGDISKPLLVVKAEGSNKEYEIKPKTSYVSSKQEGDSIIGTKVDLGRTIHVGSHGIVDEFFEYSIRNRDENSEIIEFLKTNKDKLLFKIRGYPYGDIDVILVEDNK